MAEKAKFGQKKQINRAWKFSRIREGDTVVAIKGDEEILGIGTVTDEYYFADEEYGHRLKVEWEDTAPKRLVGSRWKYRFRQLKPEEYRAIVDTAEPLENVTNTASVIPTIVPPDRVVHREYTIDACSKETFFTTSQLKRWVTALERKRQGIFYGPPGTGKTFLSHHIARHLLSGGSGVVRTVQFHPEYSYQDFMQGIRPQTSDDKRLIYENVSGVFKQFCKEAEGRNGKSVFVIDEINRANLARVFGELMYLLEYRDEELALAGGGRFKIPENVHIIGTMNTADRSIALVDYALRRRFAFLKLSPDYDVLSRFHNDNSFEIDGLVTTLKKLNAQINDPHYEIGISFFMVNNLDDEIEDIWTMEIEPYLEEYFFDDPGKSKQFCWENVKDTIDL